MSDWLATVRETLDGAGGPVTFFFRDDDAGWSDAALRALLETFQSASVPLDLAVIPKALGAAMAGELDARRRAHPELLGLHQHGFDHSNHEAAGRKCEFGSARSRDQQMHDLERGRQALRERLGAAPDPIFSPPWNRCTQTTVDCLAALGYRVLSRDRTATPLALGDLLELPVNVDWCRARGAGPHGYRQLGRLIAAAAADTAQVGVMLHHAVMDAADLDALRRLGHLLSHHQRARCRLMSELAGTPAPGGSPAPEVG